MSSHTPAPTLDHPIVSPPSTSSSNPPFNDTAFQRTTTFPHKTSPDDSMSNPFTETDTLVINTEPIELDSTSVGLETVNSRGGGELKRTNTVGSRSGGTKKGGVSPDIEEEEAGVEVGVLGRGDVGELRAKRAQHLATRSKDPAVLVDLPQGPTADEVAAAQAVEGVVTPKLE
ncbi:hypothetical protein GQ43DRAFT_438736 [Delitschia confertaspora ATCC 74209]|uniref:Uncharacterized protein n=1 Tax=Delitschia confertaspora ATCC 74209 TaxID=1513339 RepID=A0A9P4JQX3_9PLEO|nr:hypothetical protein GQ43DRAFT_438736 [Delitschia confertaspora ATCC 74209]